MVSLSLKSLISTGLVLLGVVGCAHTEQVSSNQELLGAWSAEEPGIDAMTVITDGYAAFLVMPEGAIQRDGAGGTDDEIVPSLQGVSAATLKFQVMRPGRWSMEFINSLDSNQNGLRVLYDYDWLDDEKTRMQYWVLDENGNRTEETGISKRLK